MMTSQPRGPDGSDPNRGDGDPAVACDLDRTSFPTFRTLVRQLLHGQSGVVVEDAVLVADELVTNAHRHGAAPRAGRLYLVNEGRGLLIEVDDSGPAQPRMAARAGRRGLTLVDRLASRWGVRRHPRHKTVWAELPLAVHTTNGRAPHLSRPPKWKHLD
jgi:hypothetical protein